MKPADRPFLDLTKLYDAMSSASVRQRAKLYVHFRDKVIPQHDQEAWQIYRCCLICELPRPAVSVLPDPLDCS